MPDNFFKFEAFPLWPFFAAGARSQELPVRSPPRNWMHSCSLGLMRPGLNPPEIHDFWPRSDASRGVSTLLMAIQKRLLRAVFFVGLLIFRGSHAEKSPCSLAIHAINQFILADQFNHGSRTRGFYEYTRHWGIGFLYQTVLSETPKPIHFMGLGEGEMVATRQLAGVPVAKAMATDDASFFWWDPKTEVETAKVVVLDAKNTQRFNVSSISAVTTDSEITATKNFQPYRGTLFSEIPTERLLLPFGKVDVFGDFWGVLAYTATLSEDLNKILDLSHGASSIFLRVRGKHSLGLYGTQIKLKSGPSVDLPAWLKSMNEYIDFKEVAFRNGESSAEINFKVDPATFRFPALKLIDSPPSNEIPPLRVFEEIFTR